MEDRALRIYHALPGWGRIVVASARGYQLRCRRYARSGPLVEAALERETWPAARWLAWQREELARTLDWAATRVPYYREQWATRRRHGDRASWDCVENWPVLEKDDLRAAPQAFLADKRDRGLHPEITSGTTGSPVRIWSGARTARVWYALAEARWRGWNGLSRQDRWATFGSQIVVPIARRRPPFWVWNRGLNQLYLSAYHLSPEALPHYLDALVRYRVRYLWGHTSALCSLARQVLRSKRDDIRPAVILTSAEPLRQNQRILLGKAFGCPVRETYGMSEMLAAASECQFGGMHLWPETGWLEVLSGNQPVPAGSPGDLVATGFLNRDMPLVRYRIGDMVTLPVSRAPCACGRTLPLLGALEGRIADAVYTKEGRRITPAAIEGVLDAEVPFREAQLLQESPTSVCIRYVQAEPLGEDEERLLVERVRARMGEVEVRLEAVPRIDRGAGGKIRTVVSLTGRTKQAGGTA